MKSIYEVYVCIQITRRILGFVGLKFDYIELNGREIHKLIVIEHL